MKPPMMCRNVLLPQPLGPITVMNSPSRAAKRSTSRIWSVWPFLVYDLRRPVTSSAIALMRYLYHIAYALADRCTPPGRGERVRAAVVSHASDTRGGADNRGLR